MGLHLAALAPLHWRPVDDIELLNHENAKLAELELRMDAVLLNTDSSSQTPPATGSN